MGMPNNLILIRHGESEGNKAVEAAKKGDTRYYDQDNGRFMTVPGHQWRLTDLGRAQANAIGQWVESTELYFERHYVSPYVRTRETAAHLELDGAQWLINRALRERDWGDIGSIPRKEFLERYPDNAHQRSIDPLYWTPPGGESIAHVAENRVRNVLSTLHRECDSDNVIAVAHGELMWAFRLILEYWNDDDFVAADEDKGQKIHNCQAIHYTRVDPMSYQGEVSSRLAWMRRATPVFADGEWTVEVSEWQHFNKPLLSNEDLLAGVDEVPFLL